MRGIGISGWGVAVPERPLTNAELAGRYGVDEEWIVSRTGIRERRVAGPTDSTATLATEAGRRALARAGLTGADIAHLVVASATPEQASPATAAFVQHELAVAGGAHDLNAECSGFVYGLVSAAGLVALGSGPVLLIGADTHSRQVDPADRDVGVLMGDGAGAVVIEPRAETWLAHWDLGCDGSHARSLEIRAGGSRLPASRETVDGGLHYVRMRATEVYVNAIRYTVRSVRKVLEAAKIEPTDVDHLVPHQANLRMMQSVVEHTGLGEERLISNIDRYGNTAAASIPIALSEALDAGVVRDGHRVLLAGFGAGMTWGAALLEWGS
ncbi:MAG: 3-oxoacyl-ACP synthase III family protein [Acidimicrobiales bacterium]